MDKQALNACMHEFAERMEALGAGALVVCYSVDEDFTYSGSSTGFGEGPILMQTLEGMLANASKNDAISVLAAARKFSEPPDDIDWSSQIGILEKALDERDTLRARLQEDSSAPTVEAKD